MLIRRKGNGRIRTGITSEWRAPCCLPPKHEPLCYVPCLWCSFTYFAVLQTRTLTSDSRDLVHGETQDRYSKVSLSLCGSSTRRRFTNLFRFQFPRWVQSRKLRAGIRVGRIRTCTSAVHLTNGQSIKTGAELSHTSQCRLFQLSYDPKHIVVKRVGMTLFPGSHV